jgi:hypothetical protein
MMVSQLQEVSKQARKDAEAVKEIKRNAFELSTEFRMIQQACPCPSIDEAQTGHARILEASQPVTKSRKDGKSLEIREL